MTTSEIARTEAEFAPASAPALGTAAAAMEMLRNHAEMMRMAHQLATAMVGTSMVPKIYQRKNPKDEEAAHNATAAILYGLEVGLNPIQSLQQIFPVHGQPSMYAKTMVALLKSKGYKFKTVESGPERVTVSGWWPGDDPETSTWDMDRATKAGFVPTVDPDTGKYKTKKFDGPNGKYEKMIGNEKYLTQPEEMLWAKAASTVCRRLAPDVLLGIAHAVEDLESEPETETAAPVRVRSERVTAADILGPEQKAETVGGTIESGLISTHVSEAGPVADAEGESLVTEGAAVDRPVGGSGNGGGEVHVETRSSEKLITRTQLTKLHAMLGEVKLTDRDNALAYLTDLVGRGDDNALASSKDLTASEAQTVFTDLQKLIDKQRAAQEGGEN